MNVEKFLRIAAEYLPLYGVLSTIRFTAALTTHRILFHTRIRIIRR